MKELPVYHERTRCLVGKLLETALITHGPGLGHVTLWKRIDSGISIRTPVTARALRDADGDIMKLFVERSDDFAQVDGFEQY